MSTKRNNELMKIADQVLQSGEATLLEILAIRTMARYQH